MELGDIANKIKYIIITHCHFDHILKLDEWISKTGVIPTLSLAASDNVKSPHINCYGTLFGKDRAYSGECNAVFDNDVLLLGDAELKIIITPGHTDGSLSVLAGDCAFVGDAIFAHGSYGRCDLPTGDPRVLRESIKRILSLNPETKIMPGHGEPVTVFEARRYQYL